MRIRSAFGLKLRLGEFGLAKRRFRELTILEQDVVDGKEGAVLSQLKRSNSVIQINNRIRRCKVVLSMCK